MSASGPRTLSRRQDRRLVIECPNRCQDMGCSHDGDGQEWRESVTLPEHLVIEQARDRLEEWSNKYPASGPYRLVEYVTETKTTMEVIES